MSSVPRTNLCNPPTTVSPRKAVKAKELLEQEGFEGMIDIVQDEIPIDAIEVGSQMLEL